MAVWITHEDMIEELKKVYGDAEPDPFIEFDKDKKLQVDIELFSEQDCINV